jgi:hypothetical protein
LSELFVEYESPLELGVSVSDDTRGPLLPRLLLWLGLWLGLGIGLGIGIGLLIVLRLLLVRLFDFLLELHPPSRGERG